MRFVDLLRATVLLSLASASMLAVVAVVKANVDQDQRLVFIAMAWWLVAGAIGAWLGRRLQPTEAVATALREAKTTTMLPEMRQGRILLNRLWPLLAATVVAAALALAWPQIAAIAAGFCVIWSLSWRHQEAAVTAIEERDGVTFFVASTAVVGPVRLVRTPGLRREVPTGAVRP
jgi:hypothetical protein